MDEKQFYTYKNGEKAKRCKKCLTKNIDIFDPNTFLWLLEKFNIPYSEQDWNIVRDMVYARDPYKMNGMTVFSKYLAKMKLPAFKLFSWADSERFNFNLKQEDK